MNENKKLMPKDLFIGMSNVEVRVAFFLVYMCCARLITIFNANTLITLLLMVALMIALVFIFHYTSHRVTLDDRIRSQYEPVWEYVTPDVFNTICEYKKSQNYLQNFIYKMIALGVVDALLIFMSIYAQWNPFIVFIVIISVLFFLQFYSEYLNEKRWTKISDSAQYCYLPVKVLRVSSNSQNHFVYVSVVKNNRKYIYKCVCCPGQIIERIMIVSDGSKSTYILP